MLIFIIVTCLYSNYFHFLLKRQCETKLNKEKDNKDLQDLKILSTQNRLVMEGFYKENVICKPNLLRYKNKVNSGKINIVDNLMKKNLNNILF